MHSTPSLTIPVVGRSLPVVTAAVAGGVVEDKEWHDNIIVEFSRSLIIYSRACEWCCWQDYLIFYPNHSCFDQMNI